MGKNSVQLKPTELWADLHAMCSAICSSDVVGVVHIHTGGGEGGAWETLGYMQQRLLAHAQVCRHSHGYIQEKVHMQNKSLHGSIGFAWHTPQHHVLMQVDTKRWLHKQHFEI